MYRVGHSYLSAAANHHFHPISVTCPIFHSLQLPEIFLRSCSSDISIDNSIILSRFPFSLFLSLCPPVGGIYQSMWDECSTFFSLPNIWRIINICSAYLFWIKPGSRVEIFFFLCVYVYMYSINIDDCAFIKMGTRGRKREVSFTATDLIVNSINRLRLKLELKLISFFLPFERDNKGVDDWNANVFKKKKKKEIFPGEGKTLYLVDRVMKSNYNEVNDSSAPGIERCFPCMENTFVSIYRAMKRSIKGEGDCYLWSLSVQSLRPSIAYGTERLPVQTTGGSENGN